MSGELLRAAGLTAGSVAADLGDTHDRDSTLVPTPRSNFAASEWVADRCEGI